MEIRPVDVQMFINKSSQTTRTEDNAQHNMDQNLMFSEHLKKNVQEESKKTIETNKSKEQNINKDKKGNGGFYKNNKKSQKDQEKDEKEENKKPLSLSFLDITI